MPKKKAPELTDQERAKRIKEMAREIEADQTGRSSTPQFAEKPGR
jgi:hypothetical protein